MQTRLTSFLPIILMLALAGLTYFLDRWVQPPAPALDGKNRHDPDYFIEHFEAVRYNTDGTPRYRLFAERLLHYPDDDSSDLSATRLISYRQNASPVTLSGKAARVTQNGKRVDLHENVEVTRPDSGSHGTLRVRTSALTVYPDDEYATTRAAVVIDTDRLHMTGTGMDFDQRKRTFKLHSKVRARYAKS